MAFRPQTMTNCPRGQLRKLNGPASSAWNKGSVVKSLRASLFESERAKLRVISVIFFSLSRKSLAATDAVFERVTMHSTLLVFHPMSSHGENEQQQLRNGNFKSREESRAAEYRIRSVKSDEKAFVVPAERGGLLSGSGM